MQGERRVVLTVDDILRLFKDYCGEDEIPNDARVVGIRRNDQLKLVALVVESDHWTSPIDLSVTFDLKRSYGVRG